MNTALEIDHMIGNYKEKEYFESFLLYIFGNIENDIPSYKLMNCYLLMER